MSGVNEYKYKYYSSGLHPNLGNTVEMVMPYYNVQLSSFMICIFTSYSNQVATGSPHLEIV